MNFAKSWNLLQEIGCNLITKSPFIIIFKTGFSIFFQIARSFCSDEKSLDVSEADMNEETATFFL
jgi:hypothetical protein